MSYNINYYNYRCLIIIDVLYNICVSNLIGIYMYNIGVSLLVPIIGASLSEHHTAVQNPPIIYNYIITMVIRYSEHHLNVTFTYCYYNTL